MRFEVADLTEMHLAGLSHRGPYERITETFAMLFPRLASLGLDPRPDSPLVAVYYDEPDVTAPDELRSFAAVKIAQGTPTGDLQEVRLPAGRYLRAELIGPHDQIPEAWATLGGQVAEGSHTSRVAEAACFEVYVGAGVGAAADQDRTDLFWPIA